MKTSITALLLSATLSTTTALAQESEERTPDEECQLFSMLAGKFMEYRQQELDMSKLLQMDLFKSEDATFNNAVRQLAISAYEKPAYSAEENQKNAVSKYKNDVFLVCLKTKGAA